MGADNSHHSGYNRVRLEEMNDFEWDFIVGMACLALIYLILQLYIKICD